MKTTCNLFRQTMEEVIYLQAKESAETCSKKQASPYSKNLVKKYAESVFMTSFVEFKCFKRDKSTEIPTSLSMSNPNLEKDAFKVVNYKRKSRKNNIRPHFITETVEYDFFDLNATIKQISSAKEDLLASDLYSSIVASLREGLELLSKPKIEEIVCFGLGKVGDSMIARYQLALLLCLRDLYKVNVIVYDPIFNKDDCKILVNFGFELLKSNLEGKYPIKNNNTTLFYLPHCSKQLTNNLLLSNWGLQLNRCIIISNSFSHIIESLNNNSLRHAKYIYNCNSRVVELAIINTFKYYQIFNDTAIHIFPLENLRFVPEEIWLDNSEPIYQSDDIEFIANKLKEVL